MEIPDNLYYFLSTVPQVLGASFALLGVFVIFRLEAFTKSRLGASQNFLDHVKRVYNNSLPEINALNQAQIGHNYEGTILAMTGLINFFTPMIPVDPALYNTAEMIGWRNDFINIQNKANRLKKHLIICLSFTLFIITISLIILLDLGCFKLDCLQKYLYTLLLLTILDLGFMIWVITKSL